MLEIANRETVLHFIDFFKSQGINDNGICGLLGNVYAESKVRTNNLQNRYNTEYGMTDEEFVVAVDNGSFNFCDSSIKFGFGLCQWTSYGRRCGLYNYCKAKGVSIADEQAQFEWLMHELQNSYKTVLNELISNSNTVESCAEIVLCKFEVPQSVIDGGTKKQNTINTRVGYAKEFKAEFFGEEIKMANKVIAINAGHWLGNSKGVPKSMPILGGTLEWTLNSKVVDKVVEKLKNYDGATVIQNYDVTGQTKSGNELSDRIAMAEAAKADIYLSIHHNGGINGGTGGGTVVYYYKGNTKNQQSATRLYNEIKSRTNLAGNRSNPICGTRNLQEITATSMPAFLIECAFMDSVTDIYHIAKDSWADEVADGIVAFLVNELNLTKKVVENVEKPIEIVDNPITIRIRTNDFTHAFTLNKGDLITIERV